MNARRAIGQTGSRAERTNRRIAYCRDFAPLRLRYGTMLRLMIGMRKSGTDRNARKATDRLQH